jgi:uncharacterized protein (TIGR03435 family)
MTRFLASSLTLKGEFLLTALSIAVLVGPLLLGVIDVPQLCAQSPGDNWETAAGGKASFDVASVKPNPAGFFSGTLPHSIFPLVSAGRDPLTGGLFWVTDYPISGLIAFAYKLSDNDINKGYSQLPKWATIRGFDIQARATGNPTKDQFRLMVRSLLVDRFKFAMHYDVRQAPVYYLVLLKPRKMGPRLRAHRTEVPCSSARGPGQTVAGGFPAACGDLEVLNSTQPDHLIRFGARNVSMALIADSLPAIGGLDRPVFDRTGLSGNFDLILEWDRRPLSYEQSDTAGPTFMEALKNQLGLKLDARTGTVNTFVHIDHVEEPSPD